MSAEMHQGTARHTPARSNHSLLKNQNNSALFNKGKTITIIVDYNYCRLITLVHQQDSRGSRSSLRSRVRLSSIKTTRTFPIVPIPFRLMHFCAASGSTWGTWFKLDASTDQMHLAIMIHRCVLDHQLCVPRETSASWWWKGILPQIADEFSVVMRGDYFENHCCVTLGNWIASGSQSNCRNATCFGSDPCPVTASIFCLFDNF